MKPFLEISWNTEKELPLVAGQLLTFAGDTRTWLFYGEVGAGKTTLIKEICKKLGSMDQFSSPTYSIVNEYSYPGGKIFHFDLYRVKDVNELYDLGMEEYLASGHYCFIEWPEIGEELFNDSALPIHLKTEEVGRTASVRLK